MGRAGRSRAQLERTMVLDLAAHLRDVSAPPAIAADWSVDTALSIADDALIGGDFVVFAAHGSRLQAVVVDNSGKGTEAATRSVMLAGAISGLLGEVPTQQLLPALNRHLIRLAWDEAFATAVHLDLDLTSGGFSLGVAGHPAPVQFLAGSGRWQPIEVSGPALGVVPDTFWPYVHGSLGVGDGLLVVTDGVIESPGQDISVGLDRLLGNAERLVLDDFANAADRLLAQRPHAGRDDAQVLLVRRRIAAPVSAPYPREPVPTAVIDGR